MQPVLPPLPKLNPRRHDPQPAPELGDGDIVTALEPLLHVLDPALELRPPVVLLAVLLALRREHLALTARPRTDPAATHPRVKVGLALLARHPRRCALDANLALQRLPEEEQAGVGVGAQVGGLAAGAQVGVDDEAARGVELLEVDDARRDTARGELGGGEGGGLGVGDVLLRLGEPAVELRDRGRRVEVVASELATGELGSLAAGSCGDGGQLVCYAVALVVNVTYI